MKAVMLIVSFSLFSFLFAGEFHNSIQRCRFWKWLERQRKEKTTAEDEKIWVAWERREDVLLVAFSTSPISVHFAQLASFLRFLRSLIAHIYVKPNCYDFKWRQKAWEDK